MRQHALTLIGWCIIAAAAGSIACGADESKGEGGRTPTHKQVRSIRPMHNGGPIHLNTYCLSPSGDILACVGGTNYTYKRDANGNYTAEQVTSDSFVQVYNPEGELKAEWPVPFKPTAINLAPDETIFVAGEGKIARLSAKGDVLTTANIPNVGEPGESRAKAVAKIKEQNQDFVERLTKQMEFAKSQAEKIDAIPEEDRTASQKARLKAYSRQQELYQAQLDALQNQEATVEVALAASKANNVTALAVSDSHVFVCANSTSGGGYDVYRCDLDFQHPQEVLTGLHGCCGQMDIQAYKDRLLAAENTRFRVGIYDVDGKELSSFGSRDRSGAAGFGSCCNPMNVRCCSNGEIITAESSIGDIKRFSADGELLAYVGRAKISGGCKHVAVEWDEQRDRYYMMNVSDSSICVLLPLSEAPEFTEDELAAREASEGLGKQLVGDWSIPGTTAPQKTSALVAAVRTLLGGEEAAAPAAASNVPFERVSFGADGKLSISGGMYGQWGVAEWTWAAVRQQADRRTVDFEMLNDGIQYQQFRCEILGEDRLKISVLSGDQLLMTGEFARNPGAIEPVGAPAEQAEAVTSPDAKVAVPESAPEADGND